MNGSTSFPLPALTVTTLSVCGIGAVANSLIVIIIFFSSLRKSIFMILLMILAVVDNLYLSGVVMIQAGVFGFVLFDSSLFLCRVIIYLIFTTGFISTWLIVLISLERFLVVSFPLTACLYCTKRKICGIIFCLCFIACFISVVLFFTGSVSIAYGKPACRFTGSNAEYDMIIHLVAGLLYSFIPFCMMTIFNILIIKKIRKQAAFQGRSQVTKNASAASSVSLVWLMATLCAFFAVTSFPAVVVFVVFYACKFLKGISCIYEDSWLFSALVILDDINHSMNFFLYCLTGSLFRTTLLQIFKCRKR